MSYKIFWIQFRIQLNHLFGFRKEVLKGGTIYPNTQKPEQLLEQIINASSKEDDLIA